MQSPDYNFFVPTTDTLPVSNVFHILNAHSQYQPIMTKKRRGGQQLKPQFDFKVSETIHEETDNNEFETEIECPSCLNIMIFRAHDSPYYSCNECNFCLHI